MSSLTSNDLKASFNASLYAGRAAIQQRVLPAYRADFVESLAQSCTGGLGVFAGQPQVDETILVTANLKNAQYTTGRNIHLGRVHSPYYLCWQIGLLAWLDNWQPDILVAEANPRYLSTRRAVAWMHTRGRPVIGWGLGAPLVNQSQPGVLTSARTELRQRFYQMFDGMIAYSQKGAEEYQVLGFPAEKVIIAPNAVIHRTLKDPTIRPGSFSSEPVILFVGRLQARKRIDNLLRACTQLDPVIQPRLLIVGDGPARNELEQLAQSIYPQAEFTGALHGAALEPCFNEADLFVLPGTGGLAVQQALGYGLPIIAAEGDGTLDDLVRPDNGWRVPANNIPVLKDTLQEALMDPERLRKMGRESYRIGLEEVNIETMVSGFLDAFCTISYAGRFQ